MDPVRWPDVHVSLRVTPLWSRAKGLDGARQSLIDRVVGTRAGSHSTYMLLMSLADI